MGVTRRLFLDLIQEKVRSWLAGFSGRSGMSGSADYLMCCNCCSRVPMGTGRPRCRACSQLLCGQCMPAAADGIAEEGEPGGILCKDGPWRLPMICKFCSRAAGLAGAAADPEEGTESLTTPQQQCSPPSLHCSTARSYDEEEEEEEEDGECPGKHIWSPCSIFSQDVSDVDSSSFSTGNEFYSFKCLTPSPLDSPNSYEPGKLDLLEQDPLDSLRSSERVTGEPACAEVDQLIHLDIRAQEDCKPIDIENNDRLWLPPPPKDEGDDVENGYFEYDDEEDGVGHLGLFSTSSSFGRGNGDNDGHDDDDDDDDDDNDDGGGGGSFSIKERPNDAQKELLRTSVYGHFRALVSQLLNGEGIPSGTKDGEEGWLDVVSSLSWQAANFVKPDTSRGASMDPADYVKVKCITSGRPRESVLVKGVVCTKNVKHKRMISQHKNPRLLLLGGALEYQKVSNKLASLETVLQQEIDHLKMAVAKIEAHRPNVLLVEKTVSSYAQEYLLAKEISLVLNVKKPLLERISRCTGAQISPSVDNIASTRLGHCEVFRIERTTEEGFLGNQPGKKFSRTLMFFEGCPRRLGCTVLLRGPNRDELKKVKHILLYASFAAYHLSLETSFLADSGATLRRTPQNHQLGSPFGGECGAADSISGALDFPGPDAPSPGHSGGLVRSARDESNPPSDPISTDPACSSASALSQRGGLCSSVSAPELGSAMGSDYQALDSGAHEERMAWVSTGKDSSPPGDYFSTSEGQQSILVSLSSSCVLKGIVCERSKLLRIKFYGNFDKPLGRYLRDDLFDQTSFCRCCREPPEAHVRCFTHQQGSLTINVKRLLSAKLPGECDGRIWMWHRCLRCAHKDGVPPATQRVVMSDAAWGLSFGKFLELSFSNQAIANRVASCGHSLQKDCLRFFGFGSMVAFFHYSPVNLLSVRLPPFELEFASQSQQEWLRREAGQIAVKVDLLHGEVLDVLRGVERKIAAHVDEPLKASLGNLLTELKDLLKNERHKYDVFLQTASLESFQRGHASSEVLELNRLRRCLLVDSYIWDRRIYLLDSKVKSSSLEIDVHLLEVSIHNDLMQRSESLPIGRRVDLSPKSGAKEPEGVDLLPSPVDCCAEPASGDSIYDENDCNERMAGGAAAERSPMGSSSSPGSSLSDKIDSAWTGTCHSPNGSPLSENDGYRKSTVAPVRVYSFDSSLVVRRRFHDLAPALPSLAAGDQLGFVRDPSPGIQRAYSHQSPGGIENLRFLFGRMPLYISSANRMVRDGARLLLPQTGARNVVIAVYDKEPSSVIAYALSSREHSDFVACGLDQDETPEKDPIKDQWGRRAGASASRSLELEDVQSQYYGSEEALFSQGSVFLEPRQPHFKLSFVDESSIPSEKARFSVTCYFAKEFDALRRKCCPNELDVVCSLGRCRRWDAQGGKSNVYFAKSLDERFIIKQVTKTELESFEDFAPQYFKYLTESINSGSPTCLAKILGIYQVTIKHLKGGREVRMDLMVMENLFFGRNISRVYDLKGSLRSRYNANATGGNKVMLDLNLLESLRTEPIFLGSKAKRSLERAIWNDTSFLATVDVMDYSLLVGIDEEKKELVLGIIDFLRQYTWDKHLETWVKASGILGGPMNASPTVISPKQYKKRFRKAMSTYFLTVPDQWLP